MRRRVVVPVALALLLVSVLLLGAWIMLRDGGGDSGVEAPPERWRFATGSASTGRSLSSSASVLPTR